MRTISVTLVTKIEEAGSMQLSTEIIVNEGEEHQAGVEAKAALDRFIDGYGS